MKKELTYPVTPVEQVPEPDMNVHGADWIEYLGSIEVHGSYSTDCNCYACNLVRSWFPRWLQDRESVRSAQGNPSNPGFDDICGGSHSSEGTR